MSHIELLAINNNEVNGMAVCLKPEVPHVLTHTMIYEIRKLQNKIAERYYLDPWDNLYYIFWYLHKGNITSKGLDFNYIYSCLTNRNETAIESYIYNLFAVLFNNYIGLDLPLLSCSIVNRKLSGVSKDFFYINRICFITQHQSNKCNYEKPIVQLTFADTMEKRLFPNEIYIRNTYYKLYSFDISEMRNSMYGQQFAPLSREDKDKILHIFDEERDHTLKEIYQCASKNINLIYRLAKIQASEHKNYG